MSHPRDPLSIEWVSADIIRQHFNNGQYLERVQSGELVTVTKRNSHRAPPGEPFCTHSQIVYYYTKDDQPVAVVHQYLRPDGTLGASGRPDPKRIFLEHRILSVRSAPHDQQDARSSLQVGD